ncbi:hypothetical protein JCM14469_34860 [Desulfatiferula olefinivorans]
MTDNPTRPLFIQFAGQGVKYMEDLRRMYAACPAIRPFIADAERVIKEQAALYDDSRTGFFNRGLDVTAWITRPETTPDLGYLLSSPLSHPLIFLTQMSTYLSVLADGVDPGRLLDLTHSATGFSTGIVAAILVSMGRRFEAVYEDALKAQAMFFRQGVRCQEAMLTVGSRPVLDASLYDSAEGCPSCMAGITHLMRGKLDQAILAFADRGAVYPAYDLFPGRFIVSGLPDHLSAFHDMLKALEPQAVWRYIPSTIGAHSPLLAHAYETSPRDAERLGLSFDNAAMAVPVWSNDTGEDLRASGNIIDDVMRAYFLCPAVWRKQIKPLLPPTSIRYVLDFGPGTGVASLSENHCAGTGIQVIRCAVPLGRKKLFEEVLPELGLC